MRISSKHAGQQHMVMSDFRGGLNATTVAEMIGDNQLSEALNVELDRNTGFLRTCCGTATIMEVPDNMPLRALMYDPISHWYLFVSGKDVYRSNLVDYIKIGELTGDLLPIYTPWEDGILIASGGKLQYYRNRRDLHTIDKSPDVCNGVYIRGGKVFVYYDSTIRYSAVGDEETWTDDNNDPSASKFIEAGYKDGGKIVGLVNLSQDVLIIKDNRRVYRLFGEYPDWSIREVSRNIDCFNRLSFCAITNSVLVLGRDTLQLISTTQEYGDMAAQNVAANVANLFYELPVEETRLQFLPPLNQVWIYATGSSRVIVYDLTYNAYFERQFNGPIQDICVSDDDVFIVRPNQVTQLFDQIFDDQKFSGSEVSLNWSFVAKRQVSFNEYLVKRSRITYTPMADEFEEGTAHIGKIRIPLIPAPDYPLIYDNHLFIYNNHDFVFPADNQSVHLRQLYRNKLIDINASGKGSSWIMHRIEFDIAEV